MPFKNEPPLYSTWLGMKRRCFNPKFKHWKHYGGRGITVCDEWMSFRNFERDMGTKPTPKHSLDRIDTNGNYEPGNCRWATPIEQARNTRATRWVTIDGARYKARELADISGRKVDTIVERAERGLSFTEVVSKGPKIANPKQISVAVAARIKAVNERTHCKRGHEFTPENSYIPEEGKRWCKACMALKIERRNKAKRDTRT